MAVGRKHREQDISYKQYRTEEGTEAYGNQMPELPRTEEDTEVLRMNAQPIARTERSEADMWPRPGFSLPPGAEANESRETLGERPGVQHYGQETGVLPMPDLRSQAPRPPYPVDGPYTSQQTQGWDPRGQSVYGQGGRREDDSRRGPRPGDRF